VSKRADRPADHFQPATERGTNAHHDEVEQRDEEYVREHDQADLDEIKDGKVSVVSDVGHTQVDVENVQPVRVARVVPIPHRERDVAENDRAGHPERGADDGKRNQRARGARETPVPVPERVLVVRREIRAQRNLVAGLPYAAGVKQEDRDLVAAEQEVRHAAEVQAERQHVVRQRVEPRGAQRGNGEQRRQRQGTVHAKRPETANLNRVGAQESLQADRFGQLEVQTDSVFFRHIHSWISVRVCCRVIGYTYLLIFRTTLIRITGNNPLMSTRKNR